MSRKFRPSQCPQCLYESKTENIKFPALITKACEGIRGGYSTSHASFKGKSSHSCPDFKPNSPDDKRRIYEQ